MSDVLYALTEEQQLLQKTARRFVEDRVPLARVRELMGVGPPAPGAEATAYEDTGASAGYDRGLWSAMADLGWLGLAIPEAHGGAGYGMAEVAVVLEELGRGLVPSPFLGSAVLGASALLLLGDDDQRHEHLPAVAAGERVLAVGLLDDAYRLGTDGIGLRARRAGGGWMLDGAKRGVVDGVGADAFVVAARAGDADDAVAFFMVDAVVDGLTATAVPTLDLTRKQADLAFDDVRVAGGALLGGGSDGGDVLAALLRIATVAIASEQIGGAQRCFEMAVAHAKTRFQFGRPIGSFQAVKHVLADDLMALEHARSTALHAARTLDDPAEAPIAAPLAKAVCSDAYLKVAGDALQVHGGIGFTWEHDVHLFLKRAKASSLLFGSVHQHRALLGEALGL